MGLVWIRLFGISETEQELITCNLLKIIYYIFKKEERRRCEGRKALALPIVWEGGEHPLPQRTGSARGSSPRTFFFLLEKYLYFK
jgi:hypothetical protein